MTQLYVLAQQYRDVAVAMADMDLDEKTIADTLESMAGEFEVKAANVAMLVRNLEVTATAIKEAVSQMTDRCKAIDNRAANLRSYLLKNMLHANIAKIETPYIRLGIRTNQPSVVILEGAIVPEEFKRPPPPREPDKPAIKAAIESGRTLSFARLVPGKRVEIK